MSHIPDDAITIVGAFPILSSITFIVSSTFLCLTYLSQQNEDLFGVLNSSIALASKSPIFASIILSTSSAPGLLVYIIISPGNLPSLSNLNKKSLNICVLIILNAGANSTPLVFSTSFIALSKLPSDCSNGLCSLSPYVASTTT